MGGDGWMDDNKLLLDNETLPCPATSPYLFPSSRNRLRFPFDVPKMQGYETEKSNSWLGGLVLNIV